MDSTVKQELSILGNLTVSRVKSVVLVTTVKVVTCKDANQVLIKIVKVSPLVYLVPKVTIVV